MSEEKVIDSGLTLYEANKMLVDQLPQLDPIALNTECKKMAEYFVGHEYVMLLSNENRDFSVFHIPYEATVSKLASKIANTINVRGVVKSVEQQEDGAFEIWIKEVNTNELFVYYLFDFQWGMIEV